jgi:hypothetical protein
MANGQSEESVVASGETASRFRRFLYRIRWACLPSFGAACTISLGVLLACVIWTLSDAWFRTTAEDLFWTVLDGSFSEIFHLPELIPRTVVLLVLSFLGFWSFGVVAFCLFAGKRGGRSVRSWIMAVALCAAWLSLWSSWDSLNWLGLRLRVRAALPRFEAAVESIPDYDVPVSLPGPSPAPLGRYNGWFVLPISSDTSFSCCEEPGWLYYRTNGGTLDLCLESCHDCLVEYHPSGSVPASFNCGTDDSEFRLVKGVRLKGSWYLVRYE